MAAMPWPDAAGNRFMWYRLKKVKVCLGLKMMAKA